MASMNSENVQVDAKANLFIEYKKSTAILLVDSSGSTRNMFNVKLSNKDKRLTNAKDGSTYIELSDETKSKYNWRFTVFDKITEVAKGLGHDNYRVIFWNAPHARIERFKTGAFTIPFVVKPDALDIAFKTVKDNIEGDCLTFPHVAFEAIPKEWLTDSTTIYYITDGEIGYSGIASHELAKLKNQLHLAIRDVASNARLHIITVEPHDRDFTQVESLYGAAGCDVYKLITENKLTGLITKFVSYTPSGEFVHINKNKPPAGYVPYGDKYFSELKTQEFIQYISAELKNKLDDNSQLQIAQNLSATLEVLTRDKPKYVANDIIRTFCDLFILDSNFVRFILTEAIERERSGTAAIFANYRAQLKDLFKQADQMLQKSVSDATGLGDQFISCPINGRVLTGSSRLVDKSVTIGGVRYPAAAYSIGNALIPVMPVETKLTEMNEQCLRQWMRSVYGVIYKTHPFSDEIIYLVLGTVVLVVNSDVPDNIKEAYRQLGTVMLKKKRLNSMVTELDRLESGELPIPNSGRIEDFYGYMKTTSEKLGIVSSPMRLWGEMCKSLGNKKLSEKQLRHFADYMTEDIKMPSVVCDEIPSSSTYDYNCLITLDDISAIGGYYVLPHINGGGNRCCPVYLFSEAGKKTMLESDNCVCPICYTSLSANSFREIGPKEDVKLPDSYKTEIFNNLVVQQNYSSNRQPNKYNRHGNQSNQSNSSSSVDYKHNPRNFPNLGNKLTRTGTLVILKGVVGCGKSTYAQKAKNMVEARGGVCIVEGTDKYCRDGYSIKDACQQVTKNLLKVNDVKNDDLVVIIDTCGERSNGNKVFDLDFTGWKKVEVYPNYDGNKANLYKYFAWSLRNVLSRELPDNKSNYWLNPVSAGVATCIDVHRKKANALFGNTQWNFRNSTLSSLKTLADEYAKTLVEPVYKF